MLKYALSLRLVMLIASIGAALGALLMFLEGGAKIIDAAKSAVSGLGSNAIVASIMGATDAFLFGIVLVTFAYAITFGFVLDLSPEERATLPAWMRAQGVPELKDTLIGVILVYLVVDFATDLTGAAPSWEMLTKPLSIFLIAAAF